MRTIVTIVVVSLIGAGIYLVVRPRAERAGAPPASRGPAPAITGSWTIFRGEPSLRGVAPGTLPEAPKLWWRFETKGSIRSSATIDAGVAYVGSDDTHIYAIDLATGDKRWSFKTGDTVEAPPLILEGIVYVGSSDCFLYAIKDGALLWKYETGDKILGSATWTRAPDGKATWLVVGSYDSKLHCVDAATGSRVWAYETSNYVNGAAGLSGGTAVFGGCDGIIHVVALADGTEVAAAKVGNYVGASAAVLDGRAYVGNHGGTFFCIDVRAEGVPPGAERIVWEYKERDFPCMSSAAVGETRVVFGCQDRRVHCLDRATGAKIWTFAAGGDVDSSPVICGDRVVVGSSDGRLYILDLAGGTERWSYEIGAAVLAGPAVAGGLIVAGAEDGFVYAFGPPR